MSVVPPISWFNKIHAVHKLLFSLALAVGVYFICSGATGLTHVMISWDAFCVSMLILTWITFSTIHVSHIRKQAKEQDESLVIIFILVLVGTLAGLATVILLISTTEKNVRTEGLPIALTGMMLSWLLVHTLFTLRYAHLFYSNDKHDASINAGGLEFPGEDKPDYIDFAYFSFVIGMTFQVSDVEINSKVIRRLALVHGFIAFIFNTVVVALTINAIGGISK